MTLILFSVLIISCTKGNVYDSACEDGKYVVTINSPSTRALDDQVQGGGKYSDGETVSLYTTELKFTAEANGSAGGKWLSDDPQSRVTLTSGINQDWSVTIKDYYCDVTFDNTAAGGDGTIKTESMKFGEQLPTPVAISGYTFEGWFDGDIQITTVPNNPKIHISGKFNKKIQVIGISVTDVAFNNDATALVFTIETNFVTDIDLSLKLTMHYQYDKPGSSPISGDISDNFLFEKGHKNWVLTYPFRFIDPVFKVIKETVQWSKADWDDIVT